MNMSLISILVCCMAVAAAEDTPPTPAVTGPSSSVPADALGLAEALAISAERNETTEIAEARLEHARALARQARAALLPQVSASASVNRTWTSYPPYSGQPAPFASDTVAVDLTLFDPTVYPSVRAARKQSAAQELTSRELRRTLAFQVTSAFLQTISAEKQVDAALHRREVAQKLLAETRARVQVGLATSNDATRSELELSTAELTLTNDELAARTARLSLGDLLGTVSERPLVSPPKATVPVADTRALYGIAVVRREDLRAQALQVDSDSLLMQSARAGYLPSLSLRGAYNNADPSREALADVQPDWSLSLVASWTLYDGGSRGAQVTEREADRRVDDATLRANRRHLERDLAITIATLRASQVAISQAQSQLKVAQVNLDEIRARVAQGLATGLQEADASASLFEAESTLIARQFDFDSSSFQLRQFIGWWPLVDDAPR